jgi:queuine tRNA-ribosyltransferase
MITITHSDPHSRARAGILHLSRGDVPTPAFMPVGTAATVKAMPHEQLERLGFNLILGNTYHLYLRPGMEVIRRLGGLHSFSGWPHNLLTDSGGFQVFSLARLRKISIEGVTFRSHIDGSAHTFTPEGVVDIQRDFGSDVQMALDVCTAPGVTRTEA